ncbi:MAG: GAF domain-containing protein [Chloroflexi bacterium]|nr:GAF domain-containing protein [Chloroflexota bacterium]
MKERFNVVVAWFDRLRYSQKFMLVSLLFAVPTMVVLTILVSETASRIELYGYREKSGVQYLRVTRHLMADVQQHQLLASAALSGGDVSGQIAQVQQQIDQDFASLAQIDQQYGDTFKSGELMRALPPQWATLKQGWSALTPDESLQGHTEMVSSIRALISLVGNASYLILDPDLDTYYMVDTIVLKLPESQDLVAQLIGIGQRVIRRRTLIPDDRADLQAYTSLLQSNLAAMQTSVQVAFNNNPAQNLRPALETQIQAYREATDQLFQALKSGITNTPTVATDPVVILESGQQALAQSYRLYDAAALELETLLQRRIEQLSARQFASILFSLIASLIAAAIGAALMRAISRQLAALTTTTERLATGDLAARVQIAGQSEAAQVGTAFNQMAQQLSQAQKSLELRTAQINAGAEVGRVVTSLLDTDALLRTVVELITNRFGFYYTAAFLLDSTRQQAVLREASGTVGHTLKETGHRLDIGGQSMVSHAIQTRQLRIALDVGAEAVRFANPLLPDTRSEIALPLMAGGRVLGALDVQSTQAAAFDQANAAVLQNMANQIAIALSNAELFKQTEITLQNTRNLFAASQKISTATDTDSLLHTLISYIAPDASRAGIMVFGPRDETGQPTYFEFVSTWVHADFAAMTQVIRPGTRFTAQQLPVVSSVTSAQPLVVPDASADEVSPALRTLMHRIGAEAMTALALVAGQNPLGILIVGYRQARTFSADYLQTLVTLGSQAAIVIQNQRSLAETQAALKQLDAINRRLTGEAWQAYTAPLGGALTIQDVAPGAQGASPAADLSTSIVVRGEPIGALKLQDVDPDRAWSAGDRALLEAVASEIAISIDNARLLEQTERRAQREQFITEVSRKMLAASNMQSIIQIAGDELSRALTTARVKVEIGAGLAGSTAGPAVSPEGNGGTAA